MLMKWKSLFAAALSAAVALPALAQDATGGGIPFTNGRSISVNFATGQRNVTNQSNVTNNVSGDARFGLANVAVAGSQWDNITGTSAADQALKVSGATSGAKLTFRAGATWSVNDPSTALGNTNALLGSFLDDGTAIIVGEDSSTFAAEITVANIPFEHYDVYLYSNVNNGSGFKPIQVNGTYYTYANGATVSTEDTSAQWGATAQTTPQLGRNVLVVSDVTGDALTIRTLTRIMQEDGTRNIPRGSFAGFQIVERVPPTISVNLKGTANANFPHYPETLVGDTTGFSGLVPVVNANWNEVETPTGDGSTPEIIGAKDSTGAETTATINLAIGGGWTLKGLSQEVQNARTTRIGKMGLGYADASKNTTPEVTLSDIPYTEYSVILYYATDNKNMKWAPAKVTAGDNKTYYYYYGEDVTLKSDGTAASTWGSSNDCIAAATTGMLGEDTMRIDGLSGDVSIDLDTSSNTNNTRGGLSGLQIVCTGKVIPVDPTKKGVISLNFNSGTHNSAIPATETTYGLVAVPGNRWTNLTGTSNTTGAAITTALNTDLACAPSVTFSSTGGYQYNANQSTCPYLRGYLDDGGNGVSVDVANVPYGAYDAVVYLGGDLSGRPFNPVQVNDTYYTWDETLRTTAPTAETTDYFGDGNVATAAYGTNALRVKALDGALAIRTLPRQNVGDKVCRGGLAAVQLVERKVIKVTGTGFNLAVALAAYDNDTPVLITFAEGATVTGNVTLPDDAVVDLTAYTFGETAPFGDDLAVNAGTEIRLPGGAVSYTLATSITGPRGLVMQDGAYITDAFISGGTITRPVTYEWTGAGDNDNWSNPDNWIDGVPPETTSAVTIPLANGARKTITITEGAVAGSLSIIGPDSGTADLAITGAENGSLTISGQMLTTGNVTVTQNANITVNGKSTMVFPSGAPQTYPERGAFHVEGAQTAYNVVAGTLSVPTEAEQFVGTDTAATAGGFVVVCGDAKLTVGGGNDEAVLSVYSCRMPWPSGYPASGVALAGTVEVLSSGVFETDKNANFAGGPKLVTNGGTVRVKESSASVTYGSGYAPTSPLALSAPEGATLTFSAGESGTLLTGSADVLIKGPGTVALVGAIDAETYTGEISVQENGNLTLADNQRPKLSVVSGASLTVTPTDGEAGSGTIVFPTSMTEEPTGVTYTVSGVDEEETLSVSVNGGKLTLSWGADYPTLSTTSNWSTTESWANLPNGTTYPSEGSAILDGTNLPITVTLDTNLSKMKSIFVKGNVTLVTTEAQPAIPACVKLTTGATLTVDADFSGAWELPDGTTLQVTEDFTSFANLTLKGAVVIPGASGTTESPTEIKAPNVEFNGGLTIAASNLTLKSVYNVGKTLELAGNNITIEGNDFFTDNGTEVVNVGTDNVITGMTGLNGSLAVEGGTLALTLGASPTNTFSGATIAADATLTLAAVPDSSTGVTTARGWFFPVTGDGTLEIEVGGYDFRPMFSAVSQEATTLPKNMVFTATAAEQAAGVISCLNNANSATLPEGFAVKVNPAPNGGAWVPNAVLESGRNAYLRIYNKLPANLPVGVEDAIAKGIQQDATTAGITKGYTVQLTTKGQPVEVTADMLNDVLGCFTGLKATANAERTTLTYAYDFGIVGIKRDTAGDGWVVTAKVQGEGAAPAGFAAGNAYTLTVNGAPAADASATVGENGTVTFTVPDASVAGETCTLGVKVSRPAAQP